VAKWQWQVAVAVAMWQWQSGSGSGCGCVAVVWVAVDDIGGVTGEKMERIGWILRKLWVSWGFGGSGSD
jgi:hypothetical protein